MQIYSIALKLKEDMRAVVEMIKLFIDVNCKKKHSNQELYHYIKFFCMISH